MKLHIGIFLIEIQCINMYVHLKKLEYGEKVKFFL